MANCDYRLLIKFITFDQTMSGYDENVKSGDFYVRGHMTAKHQEEHNVVYVCEFPGCMKPCDNGGMACKYHACGEPGCIWAGKEHDGRCRLHICSIEGCMEPATGDRQLCGRHFYSPTYSENRPPTYYNKN